MDGTCGKGLSYSPGYFGGMFGVIDLCVFSLSAKDTIDALVLYLPDSIAGAVDFNRYPCL